MPLKYGNRIKVSPAGGVAPVFGDFFLGTPVTGYQSFSSAIPSITAGDTVRYVIEDGANWEIGKGTYNTTGPKIVRTEVIQSSGGTGVVINASGSSTIMVSVAAGDFVASPDSSFSGSITETVFSVTGSTPDISPTNGTIQTWTLSANSTPTFSSLFIAGQAITIMIDDGASRSISWPTITWVNNAGVAPSLSATNLTVIALWKVGTTFYGALVGDGL
jgi:hypothetical protein